MPLNEIHFQIFCDCEHERQGNVGYNPRWFAQRIGVVATDPYFDLIPNDILCRSRLYNLCQDPELPLEVKILSVLAWGGQKIKDGTATWGGHSRNHLIETMQIIHNDRNITLEDAYTHLYMACIGTRGEPRTVLGMGISYFTKLLAFLYRGEQAPILDQWTAKSANLLSLFPLVTVYKKTLYRCRNSASAFRQYQNYINLVEEIRAEVQGGPNQPPIDRHTVEERLFSKGARNGEPGQWRSYVKENYRPEMGRPNLRE